MEQRGRRFVADRAMWSYLVIVSTPILKLCARVGHRQEPVRVQAFRSQSTVERFNEGVVRRLARPREIKRHALQVSPQIKLTRDELAALVDPD